MGIDSLDQKTTSRAWGSERRTSNGYIMVYRPDHPRANKLGEVPQHTLVLEDKLGRYLTAAELAHHINHKRDDNRPENLRLMTAREHYMMHIWEAVKKRKRQMVRRSKKARPPKPRKRDTPRPWTAEEEAYICDHWLQDDKAVGGTPGPDKGVRPGAAA